MTDASAAPKVKTGKAGPSGGEAGEKKRFEVKKVHSPSLLLSLYVCIGSGINVCLDVVERSSSLGVGHRGR